MEFYIRGFITVLRYVMPALSVILMTVCGIGLLKKKKFLFKTVIITDDMKERELPFGEYVMGEDDDCDIILNGLEEKHAVLSVSPSKYKIRPINKSKISVNRHPVKEETEFSTDTLISMNDREFSLRKKVTKNSGRTNKDIGKKTIAFCCLNLIQIFVLISLVFAFKQRSLILISVFLLMIIGEWVYFGVTKFFGAFLEIPVMFMVTFGINVAAHVSSGAVIKQAICFVAGILGAILLSKLLKSPKWAIGLKGIALIFGVAVFSFNIVFGVIYNGSQNWLNIAGFSFQPSELIKVVLIFICGAAADKLSSIKDMASFVAFALFCLGSLAYLSDFGTALVYACVLATVIFIRRCSVKVLAFMGGSAVLCGSVVLLLFPYVAQRVFSFGQAWENASNSGYQQTRTMVAAASGGLFGIGGGRGSLIKVPAADTDIVFGLICEEWGLIVALCILFFFVLLALYAIKTLSFSSSTYYSVTVCAASVLLIIQTSLNVFGSMDMLPFTGVTLPFISNGGSSLISCTMLMAFFRVALKDEQFIKTGERRLRK